MRQQLTESTVGSYCPQMLKIALEIDGNNPILLKIFLSKGYEFFRKIFKSFLAQCVAQWWSHLNYKYRFFAPHLTP